VLYLLAGLGVHLLLLALTPPLTLEPSLRVAIWGPHYIGKYLAVFSIASTCLVRSLHHGAASSSVLLNVFITLRPGNPHVAHFGGGVAVILLSFLLLASPRPPPPNKKDPLKILLDDRA